MNKNIAVVGCGYWGRNLVRNFAELGALHTICDADATTLQSLASAHAPIHTETDFQRVLADERIQGVVVASPAVLHYSMAREALLAGKDVFVEKPLALRVEEGKELVELAESRSRVLLTGHLLEYHPAMTALKALVDKGELGRIQYIYSNRLNLGKFRTEENILWSFAPHDISAILLLLGGEMPQQISSHGGCYLHPELADVTLTTLAFNDGVRAHIFVSWLHPYKEQRLVVVGDRKMAEFNDAHPQRKLALFSHEIEWIDRKPVPHRKDPQAIEVPADEPLRLECQDFLACIESRRKPRVDGRKGLQVLEVLSCCQKSLEANGKVISLGQSQTDVFVHETSMVESPVTIGPGTRVWHFCHIMPDVTIGENCVLGQNVFIGRGVTIGSNVKVENNVSLFDGVTLEDDVFCGPSCVFTNVINPRSFVSRKQEFKPTLVQKGATIGANATIVCGNTIGRYAFIGAGSVVTKDVPDHAMAYGNPARVRDWVCRCGAKLNLGETGTTTCSQCGKGYVKQEVQGTTSVKEAEA